MSERSGPKETKQEEIGVETITITRDQLRDEARRRLGVTGEAKDMPPMRRIVSDFGLSWYPLGALGVLAVVDTFHTYAFRVLTPEVSSTLGIGKGVIAALIAMKTLALSVAPLPIAALVQKRPRRALVSITTGIAWSIVAIATTFVGNVWGLLSLLVADGLTTGSVQTIHRPLLIDSYPAQARVRGLSYYQAADSFGNVLAPLLVAGLAAIFGLTWRGIFLCLGSASLLATLLAGRLRDPGFGKWDTEQIRKTVSQRHGGGEALSSDNVELGFFEIVRRLLLIPTIRRLLIGFAVFGMLLIPFHTFLFFFLDERWNIGPAGRGLFFAFLAAVQVAALTLFARRAEALFRTSPDRIVRLAGSLLAGAVVFIAAAALAPALGLMVALFGIAAGFLAMVTPAINAPLLSVVPAYMRPHAAALTGIFLGGVGGVAGAIFLSGIDQRFGVATSMVSLLIPGLAGALLLRSTARFVPSDLDRMIDEILEHEEIARISASGERLPMLSCRGIDFSYGQLQVLFGVDFSVDEGEIVALLGTNGAGKSTLLRVISGLGLPTRGSVRYRGADITYLDAERRLRLGITQVPGGRAVFGPMTVVENIKAYGYSIARNRGSVEKAIERTFSAFPRLAERRNQPASTLSGGEQQMLGLAKALVLEPRLLLIDELSLGLAPVVVAQLLDMVREINRRGTAVVLVEQSVNIALNLVDHAYFMEKGEIRFDGNAAELLARDDLLRAVFLEGAAEQQR